MTRSSQSSGHVSLAGAKDGRHKFFRPTKKGESQAKKFISKSQPFATNQTKDKPKWNTNREDKKRQVCHLFC